MSWLKEYDKLIRTGQVVVGYWIKKAVRQLVEDIDDPRYIFDTTESDKRIAFMESCCLQGKAPYYKKPLVLMPWQKAFWEAVYSFRMADTGLRRFTEVLLEIARKNGKSTMFAADATRELFVGQGGADICCASNDDKQCRIIFEEAAGMRERLDPKRLLSSVNLTKLKNTKRNINICRLSSKSQSKDGFNFGRVYLDESHDIDEADGASEIAEACWRGMSSQDEPLFMNCTTQGFNRGCYLDKKIEEAKSVISGEEDDPHFLAFLFEQDSESEIWQDEASWEKSNPSLRYGVKKIDKLRRDVEKAKKNKSTRVHLLTKDFNIPQAMAQSWLALEDYDYPAPAFDLEDFRGSIYLGAVDLSATTDMSAAKVLLMKPGDRTKYIVQHYWIPESKLQNADDKAAGAQYLEWAKDGRLTICEGNEIDIVQIADWFYRLYKDYRIKPLKIGYDQRYAKAFLERCEEYGFDTEMIAQGRALSNAMKLVEADFRSKAINYNHNPVDLWNLGNICFKMDNVGDIQPIKAPGQNSRRIDGAVTLIILYETLRRYRGDFNTAIGGA